VAKYSDSNPVAGAKSAKGMKNEDGRIGGAKYNKQDKAKMDAKQTYDPNADVPHLPGRPGLEKGAY
jgi:hypothetical protein